MAGARGSSVQLHAAESGGHIDAQSVRYASTQLGGCVAHHGSDPQGIEQGSRRLLQNFGQVREAVDACLLPELRQGK